MKKKLKRAIARKPRATFGKNLIGMKLYSCKKKRTKGRNLASQSMMKNPTMLL